MALGLPSFPNRPLEVVATSEGMRTTLLAEYDCDSTNGMGRSGWLNRYVTVVFARLTPHSSAVSTRTPRTSPSNQSPLQFPGIGSSSRFGPSPLSLPGWSTRGPPSLDWHCYWVPTRCYAASLVLTVNCTTRTRQKHQSVRLRSQGSGGLDWIGLNSFRYLRLTPAFRTPTSDAGREARPGITGVGEGGHHLLHVSIRERVSQVPANA